MCMCVRARYVSACVRARGVCACVRACVCVRMHVHSLIKQELLTCCRV